MRGWVQGCQSHKNGQQDALTPASRMMLVSNTNGQLDCLQPTTAARIATTTNAATSHTMDGAAGGEASSGAPSYCAAGGECIDE